MPDERLRPTLVKDDFLYQGLRNDCEVLSGSHFVWVLCCRGVTYSVISGVNTGRLLKGAHGVSGPHI
jgi:hypothetical protein